jgi:hypothetical protein
MVTPSTPTTPVANENGSIMKKRQHLAEVKCEKGLEEAELDKEQDTNKQSDTVTECV